MNRIPGPSGSVALVTGGGRGIGRLVADALAEAGVAVGVVARSADELDETVELVRGAGGVAAAAQADVADEQALAHAVARLAAELGSPDILVNNAGILGPIGPTWEVDGADWWRTMEVNVRGVVNAANLVLPGMIARGHGRILNITSQAGAYRWPTVSAYSVSKAAVVKFSENLAHRSPPSSTRTCTYSTPAVSRPPRSAPPKSAISPRISTALFAQGGVAPSRNSAGLLLRRRAGSTFYVSVQHNMTGLGTILAFTGFTN